VDATLIAAPSSTKNSTKSRDPEMHQTKKGNQWYFGMKAHIGVDADSGLVHTVRGTSANVSDVVEANSLLHGQEVDGYGDAGYQGADKRPDMPEQTPERKFQWHIAMKRSQRKALDPSAADIAMQEQLEQVKSKIRAKVEHPFRVIKRQFGHVKVRYRGLRKNTQQLHTLFALANLWMVRARLLAANSSLWRLKARCPRNAGILGEASGYHARSSTITLEIGLCRGSLARKPDYRSQDPKRIFLCTDSI
jgi:IS5 family transposase